MPPAALLRALPNLLTLFRVALIPVLAVAYFLPGGHQNFIAAAVFVLAAVTDWLDGAIARRMNTVSKLGAFLDPVADKLIVSTALVLLVSDRAALAQSLHIIPFILAVAIIIGREIVVSALREWMAELGARAAVSVGALGKFKTASQMVAIILLLYAKPLPLPALSPMASLPTFRIGEALLYLAATLTLWSMCEYLRAARPHINHH